MSKTQRYVFFLVVFSILSLASTLCGDILKGSVFFVLALYFLERSDKEYRKPKMKTRRVVCAANRHMETGVIVCGARHFDDLMRQAIRAMNDGDWDTSWNCAEEGFVDNFGNFLTRNEAMVMARKNGQILYDAGWSKTDLYSENLY